MMKGAHVYVRGCLNSIGGAHRWPCYNISCPDVSGEYEEEERCKDRCRERDDDCEYQQWYKWTAGRQGRYRRSHDIIYSEKRRCESYYTLLGTPCITKNQVFAVGTLILHDIGEKLSLYLLLKLVHFAYTCKDNTAP